MASLIIQSPTAECYYKAQQWGKNKFKAFQDRKIPLQGKMPLCGFFIFAIILSWIHRGFFPPFHHLSFTQFLCSPSAVPLPFSLKPGTHTPTTSPHPHHPLTHSTPLFLLMQRHYSITGACQSSDRHECFIQ